MLDADADALLARLYAHQAHASALNAAKQATPTVALFGQSQAAKAGLLTALCGSGEGRLLVHSGAKTLDYLTHLNPGHAITRMALRFSPTASVPDAAFPLRLRLLSEAELVQLFIAHARQLGDVPIIDRTVISARLAGWQSLRQAQTVSGIDAREIATIARVWQEITPASQQQWDDALWYQVMTLIPVLDLSARASLWSLLWGEQQALTQQWLALAHLLHQTGNAREVAAPLNLLVDNFALPSEGFLTDGPTMEDEVMVHPLAGDTLLNAISLPVEALALLTRELVLPCENAVLDGVDLLDLPKPETSPTATLWVSKCRNLLNYYRQQLQPDLLLVCNATRQRADITATTSQLLRWVSETQPQQESTLPGLVWAITADDDRFIHKRHLDEAIQQLIDRPGQRWGTLQALDHHSLQRLVEWLSQATAAARRADRFRQLEADARQQLRDLLAPWCDGPLPTRQQAEALVRELQGHAAQLGELLQDLQPSLAAFNALCRVQPTREEKVGGLFSDAVDLFAVNDVTREGQSGENPHGVQAHRLWCQTLRQWSRQPENARRYGLTPAHLQHLAAILIVTSYRLDLPGQLNDRADAAHLHACTGNFLAWLGYGDLPVAQRPASRIVRDSAIFAPQPARSARLTALAERPVHAASHYVYDWLVALYTRATEAPDYRPAEAVSAAAERELIALC